MKWKDSTNTAQTLLKIFAFKNGVDPKSINKTRLNNV